MWPNVLTRVVVLQDLQESEGCQDELALRVQQLKGELVLFKGLMSNVSAARNSPHVAANRPSLVLSCLFSLSARVQGCVSPHLT